MTFPPVKSVYEILADLLESGTLEINIPFNRKIYYHAPCKQRLHPDISDAPSRIFNMIPGIIRVENTNLGESAYCCGGGGLFPWSMPDISSKMADRVIHLAKTSGADIIATTCSRCKRQLQQGSSRLPQTGPQLMVTDLTEIVENCITLKQ